MESTLKQDSIEFYEGMKRLAQSQLSHAYYIQSTKFLHNKEQIAWSENRIAEVPAIIESIDYAIEKLMA